MNCQELPTLCPDYHSGNLTPPEATAYEHHLASCANCRRSDADYGQGLQLLAPWPVPAPPRGEEEFVASLLEELGRHDSAQTGNRGPWRLLLPLALAATLVVAFLFGTPLLRKQNLTATPEPPLANLTQPMPKLPGPEAFAPPETGDLTALDPLDLSTLEDGLWAALADADLAVEPEWDESGGSTDDGLWAALAGEALGDGNLLWINQETSLGQELETLDPEELSEFVKSFEQS